MVFCGLYNVSWMSFHMFFCIFFVCTYYLPSLHFIVAWYKILDAKHNPFTGQTSLTKQLRNVCGSVGLGCSIFLLWPFIFDLMFGMQEQVSFIVFLLNIFTNLRFGGKCLLINLMNVLPILVLTDLLYDGLTQICCVFFSVCYKCFHLIVDIVVWFYIHWFLFIYHSKWLTPKNSFWWWQNWVFFPLIVEFP